MEHGPRAQELLTALCAAFPALRLGCYDRNAPGMAFWNAMGFEKEGAVLREGRVLHKMFLPL